MNLKRNFYDAAQALMATILFSSLLAGCSGKESGGGSGTQANSIIIGGVAAAGAPIAGGNISVICASGGALTTQTSNLGAWHVTLPGQTFPCAVEVSGGTINGVANTSHYHSIALTANTVNVSPLTDLIVANLTGKDPSTWFTGLSASPAPLAAINSNAVSTSVGKLNTALSILTPLGSNNPITTAFIPAAGFPSDDMLTALKAITYGPATTVGTLLNGAIASPISISINSASAVGTAYSTTATAPIKLNVTGVNSTQCYATGSDSLVTCAPGGAAATLNNSQDGMLGGVFNYTPVPVAAGSKDVCIQDNITGRMWEVKTTDGGLRDWTKTYTNYGDGRTGDASAYVAAVNVAGLCGHNDWRLPSADELQSIVDYSVDFSIASPGPTLDTTNFPNTQRSLYWTASPFTGNLFVDYNFSVSVTVFWNVDFSNGSVYDSLSSAANYVRLVR